MASRFWVGGTGTWDASDTTHWASSSNGAGGQTVPGSSDTVTFDGSSGTGTITVNTTVSVVSITMSALTGGSVLDFATNNNNVNLSSSFGNTGSGTRTLNMGNGTWTITGTSGNPWGVSGATNLTLNCNSSTLVLTSTAVASANLSLGAFTYNVVTINPIAAYVPTVLVGASTVATLNITGAGLTHFASATTHTITTLNLTSGSSLSALNCITSNAPPAVATLSIGNAITPAYCAFRDITKTGAGSITASNSIDLGHNTSITITAPTVGGGTVVGVIGS